MRILLIYPGPMFSVYDVAYGYGNGLAEAGATVRAYTYHNWLKFYEASCAIWTEHNSDANLAQDTARRMASERAVIEAVDFVPEVVLVVAGLSLHPRAYDLLAQLSLPVAVLLTESPYEDRAQLNMMQRGHVDLAFTNERTSAPRLTEAVGIPVVYLPHAYSPERHHPTEHSAAHETDVFFHGTLWPERKELFTVLDDLDCDVRMGGIDPSRARNQSVMQAMSNTIDNEEMAKWYSNAQIALNHHREFCSVDEDGEVYLDNGEAESIGPRAYEIAACGAFQLCDDTRPELVELFGDSVATYGDADSLREGVVYFLHHADEREEMATEARKRVRGCTFADRAREIVLPALDSIRLRR